MTDSERTDLTVDEAEKMLPIGDKVHVFMNPGAGMLVGADWSRKDIVDLFNRSKPTLSGPEAANMKHGIAVMDGGRWLFVETSEK